MRRITRRQVLSGVTVIGAGAALAACGATPAAQATAVPAAEATAAPTAAAAEATVAQPSTSGEVKEIEWWFGWSGVGLPEIAQLFMDKNPGTKVTTVDQGYGFSGKLMAAIASGTPPGLAYNVFYNELIARDLCVPMDDYIAASGDEGLTNGDIPQAVMDRWKWKGKQYGLPACDVATRYGMSYNTNLLEENGLSVPEMPQTWEEVYAWHEQMTKMDAAGNILVIGATPTLDCSGSAHGIDPWVYPFMWGVDYFDDTEGKYQIDREETYDFLALIKKFFDTVGAEKITALANDAYATANYGIYQLNKQAMYIMYPSGPGSVFNADPDHKHVQGWVPMPESRKGIKIGIIGGHASTILKGSKNPEVTFALSDFVTQKEACDVLLASTGWVGPRRSYQDTADLSKYPDYVQEGIRFFVRGAIEDADETWYAKDPIGSITQAAWDDARDSVVFGDATPEEAAAKMQAKLTDELAKVQAG
jgi:ABC-type glycerol-3-phosphate transport system substrate-binding protein